MLGKRRGRFLHGIGRTKGNVAYVALPRRLGRPRSNTRVTITSANYMNGKKDLSLFQPGVPAECDHRLSMTSGGDVKCALCGDTFSPYTLFSAVEP